jgi:hypothetical protein
MLVVQSVPSASVNNPIDPPNCAEAADAAVRKNTVIVASRFMTHLLFWDRFAGWLV